MVQWLRIHLPVQGTLVQPLVWELRSHLLEGHKASAPQVLKPACPRACALQRVKPLGALQLESRPRSQQLGKIHVQQQRPSAAKITYILEMSSTLGGRGSALMPKHRALREPGCRGTQPASGG